MTVCVTNGILIDVHDELIDIIKSYLMLQASSGAFKNIVGHVREHCAREGYSFGMYEDPFERMSFFGSKAHELAERQLGLGPKLLDETDDLILAVDIVSSLRDSCESTHWSQHFLWRLREECGAYARADDLVRDTIVTELARAVHQGIVSECLDACHEATIRLQTLIEE